MNKNEEIKMQRMMILLFILPQENTTQDCLLQVRRPTKKAAEPAQPPCCRSSISSARNALMGILGSQHFKQSDGLRIRLNALSRTVRRIDDRLAAVGHNIYFSALRNEIKDHLVVTTGGSIMQRSDSTASAAAEASLLRLLLNEPH